MAARYGTHKLPNRVSLIETEAASKAGHAVEPSREMQTSDCAFTTDNDKETSAQAPSLAIERFPRCFMVDRVGLDEDMLRSECYAAEIRATKSRLL